MNEMDRLGAAQCKYFRTCLARLQQSCSALNMDNCGGRQLSSLI